MMKTKKGGARKGAGRPKTSGRGKTLRPSEYADRWLDQYARREGVTRREALDRALEVVDTLGRPRKQAAND